MNPFSKIHHICLVVHDIEEKIKYYESIGIGPWQEYPPLSEYIDIEVPNLEGFKNLKYMLTQIGDIQLQMVQPSKVDSPQRRFLDTCGEGVYHIGFVVDDVNEGEAAVKEKGIKVLSRGRRHDASGFNYLDTKKEAGVILLIRQNSSGQEKK